MSARIFDAVARVARHEVQARPVADVAEVTSAHGAGEAESDHAVSVRLRDTGQLLSRVPVAVGAAGFAALPAVGDLVVVVFMGGDPHAPVVVGRLYDPELEPPKHAEGELVLRLPAGAEEPKVDLTVRGMEPLVELALPDQVKVTMDAEKIAMAVGKDGEMQVKIDTAGGGRAEISAGGATITLKKDGDITIETQGNLSLKGAEVSIEGSSKVTVSAPQIELN